MGDRNVIILDYGSGNVASVFNMVRRITDKVKVSNEIEDINQASHYILPGVGAFGSAAQRIKDVIPFDRLQERVLDEKVPFLGICVGMQLLFDSSEEFGFHQGFGWIKGQVRRISGEQLPVPHIGWNSLKTSTKNHYVDDGVDMYFVHSYKAIPDDTSTMLATVAYGEAICALVKSDNIMGAQFHPEKSQLGGRKLFEAFLEIDHA